MGPVDKVASIDRASGGKHRFAIALAACVFLAFAVRPAAFATGFWLDDYAHVAMLEGRFPVERGPFDLFNFSRGAPGEVARLRQGGFYPWSAHPRLSLSMLRPLSSALIGLDHALFGRAAIGYHAHSGAWLAALMVVFGVLLRRQFGVGVACVALVLFALDEAPGRALGWIANRSHLVSTACALASFLAYLRFRETGARRALGVALVGYALALAAGEYALCFAGYFVAYELCAGSGDSGVRWRALSGVLVLALVYLTARAGLGYGSYGSEMYLDPAREAAAFGRAMWPRFLVLVSDLALVSGWSWMLVAPIVGALLSGVGVAFDPLAFLLFLAAHAAWLGIAGVVVAASVAFSVGRVRSGADPETAQRARALAAWSLGSLFSLAPLLASSPDPRLLVAPELGWSVVLAAFVADRWRRLRENRGARTRTWNLVLVCFVVLAHAVGSLAATATHAVHARDTAAHVRAYLLATPPDAAALAGRRVVWIDANPIAAVYFGLVRGAHGAEAPRSAWVLHPSPFPGRLTRVAANALQLELERGDLLDGFYARTFRARGLAMKPGASVALDGLRVTITAQGASGPTGARFEFDRTLDDASWVFLDAAPAGWRRVVPPREGESIPVRGMQTPVTL